MQEVINFIIFPFRILFSPGKTSRTLVRFIEQSYEIGVNSLPLIVVIGFFLGLVTTVQSFYQIANMLPKYFLGLTVGRMVMIELGPVLTALTVTGRCISAMSAEIGTMKISEQIDALRVMKISPENFLGKPRMLSMLLVLPLLNYVMIAISLLSGALFSQLFFATSFDVFFYGITHPFYPRDFWASLIKSLFFAFWITSSGVYFGFQVSGGAKQVGQAATNAVVVSTILILILDFLAAIILF
ncbi:MAG: ABC transporter permease [candidate division WOR-3 bacterium]|nr:ABC transporter permease [candidate division WOR-3 bacterium]